MIAGLTTKSRQRKGKLLIGDENKKGSEPPAEFELLELARGGDDHAFARLAELARRRLLLTALRRTRCPTEAEDVVQLALLKAWIYLRSFRAEAGFHTWLTRILLNEISMSQRGSGYRRLEYHGELAATEANLVRSGWLPSPENPESSLLRRERNGRIHEAVNALPQSLRCVLQLDLVEMTVEEAARHLNLSVAAVKTRRLRGRAELRKRMMRGKTSWD